MATSGRVKKSDLVTDLPTPESITEALSGITKFTKFKRVGSTYIFGQD